MEIPRKNALFILELLKTPYLGLMTELTISSTIWLSVLMLLRSTANLIGLAISGSGTV